MGDQAKMISRWNQLYDEGKLSKGPLRERIFQRILERSPWASELEPGWESNLGHATQEAHHVVVLAHHARYDERHFMNSMALLMRTEYPRTFDTASTTEKTDLVMMLSDLLVAG